MLGVRNTRFNDIYIRDISVLEIDSVDMIKKTTNTNSVISFIFSFKVFLVCRSICQISQHIGISWGILSSSTEIVVLSFISESRICQKDDTPLIQAIYKYIKH